MNRWAKFSVCIALGLVTFWCGLQLPAHLRAVDGIVLQRAGQNTPTLVASGLLLVNQEQLGPARLFSAAAGNAWLADRNQLADAVEELARNHPALDLLGGPASSLVSNIAGFMPNRDSSNGKLLLESKPFTPLIIRAENRKAVLQHLQTVPGPLVQALLQFRSVTNTVLFPASSSASGQALDAAICIGGLLSESGQLTLDLNKELLNFSVDAAGRGDSQQLEQALMDMLSLGQRLDWAQLSALVGQVRDAETLRTLTHDLQSDKAIPVIFTAVCLSENAIEVAKYLTTFSETGLDDLRLSLAYGVGGVQELLHRNKRLCDSPTCSVIAGLASSNNPLVLLTRYAPSISWLAIALKWLLYLLGGFFAAAVFHYARAVSVLEKPLEIKGFHFVRELLFALGFLLVVLLLSEPFLAQGSQVGAAPFRLRLPMVGSVTPAGTSSIAKSLMNPMSLLTLLLFFVLQGLIYMACRLKLAEIRRQKIPARIRLKLLENEDHLFDAGLYLGFVGTIISLILVSLGVVKLSLMGGYSSTAFGIIFVAFFKIFSLRPLRRKLLLEAEASDSRGVPTGMAPAAT